MTEQFHFHFQHEQRAQGENQGWPSWLTLSALLLEITSVAYSHT